MLVFFVVPAAAVLVAVPPHPARAEMTMNVAIAETIKDVADRVSVLTGRVKLFMATSISSDFGKNSTANGKNVPDAATCRNSGTSFHVKTIDTANGL